MNDEKVIKAVQNELEPLKPELRELAINIHENPELGRNEFKAVAWQLELLGKYGFELTEKYCDMDTAYKAVYRGGKPGPKIAVLAEYDALPGIGHACGHNLIAMMSVGTAVVLRRFADEYGAEIHLFGTPAEETDGAKVMMSRMGVFDDMDIAIMTHPAYEDTSSINSMALACRYVEFFGKTSHAASAPENGLNALDAMINLFNLINAMRQQTKGDVRVHGIITDGGKAPNIIPDYTRGLFYIRSSKSAELNDLLRRFENCAEGAALGTGTEYKISEAEIDFKDTNSNMVLNRLACDNMERLGVGMKWLGDQPHMGSSDLGDVSYVCPSIQLNSSMGSSPDGKPYFGHTVEFCKMSGSDPAIENSYKYIEGMALTAIDIMTDPEILKAIKAEFDAIPR